MVDKSHYKLPFISTSEIRLTKKVLKHLCIGITYRRKYNGATLLDYCTQLQSNRRLTKVIYKISVLSPSEPLRRKMSNVTSSCRDHIKEGQLDLATLFMVAQIWFADACCNDDLSRTNIGTLTSDPSSGNRSCEPYFLCCRTYSYQFGMKVHLGYTNLVTITLTSNLKINPYNTFIKSYRTIAIARLVTKRALTLGVVGSNPISAIQFVLR